jgi:putative tricarboxylic transport membrane protein
MEWTLLLAAPVIGLLVGMLPALGATTAMLLLYPLLAQFDSFYIILFYCIMINAREFSGSVSAIGFNLLGEVTSAPVLLERSLIIKSNLQSNALRNTMYGSMIGAMFGCLILFFSLIILPNYKFLFRSDTIAILLLLSTFFLIFWRQNVAYVNILLMFAGYALGAVGYDHFSGKEILTFGNTYLSAGIPSLPFVFGFYALPKLCHMIQNTKLQKPCYIENKKILHRTSLLSVARGSVLGSLLGLIPFIGTTLCSTIAHSFENFFNKRKNSVDALKRITASESANNAAQVTVLIPLLILGLAIQPSEMVLLDMIENKSWQPSHSQNFLFIIGLFTSLAIGCIISCVFCYHLVKHTFNFLYQRLTLIFVTLLMLSLSNILYIAHIGDQIFYHMIVFVLSFVIGLFLCNKRVDALPIIILFLCENIYSDTLKRVWDLHSIESLFR